jgi:hypothetical protein
MMPVHNVAGAEVTVNFEDLNLFLLRRQGVSAKTDLKRRWWCLGLCRTPSDVDQISIEGILTGPLTEPRRVSASCKSCGSATAWAPWDFGFAVARRFTHVSYNGSVTKRGNSGSFEGTDIP